MVRAEFDGYFDRFKHEVFCLLIGSTSNLASQISTRWRVVDAVFVKCCKFDVAGNFFDRFP